MSLLAFFSVLNLILLSRLWLTFKDDGADLKTIIKMSVLPLFSLGFVETSELWLILLATFIILALVTYAAEINSGNIYRNRVWTLLIQVAVIGAVFALFAQTGVNDLVSDVIRKEAFISYSEILAGQILLFGGLMVMNEMNVILRYLMYALNLAPIGEKKAESTITGQQYNTGRVIGMLERIFIYSFAVSGQFAAIGFILAAKGVVRYHDFEDRVFAEYVLIGTLLSALLAMASALFVNVIS